MVTTFDGYQMARQGRAGPALGIAAIGSFVGGLVAVVGLVLLAPVLASFALKFGPPEFAVVALLGIVLAAYLASRRFAAAVNGLLRAAAGHRGAGFDRGQCALHVRQPRVAQRTGLRRGRYGLFGLGELLYTLERSRQPAGTVARVGHVSRREPSCASPGDRSPVAA